MKHRDIKISNENSDVCSQKDCNNQSKRSVPRKRAEKSAIFDLQGYSRIFNITCKYSCLIKARRKCDYTPS